MTTPEETPNFDPNKLSAEDVTVPKPETVTPSPVPHSGPPHSVRRPWRQTRERPNKQTATKTTRAKLPPEIPRPKRGMFVKPLTQTYTTIGIMLMPVDAVCANLYIVNAESCAKAWDDAAYENDAIRKWLVEFQKKSIGTRIALAHLPILLGMMMHHSKRAQDMLRTMGEGFAETVENNLRVGDMGNGVEEP